MRLALSDSEDESDVSSSSGISRSQSSRRSKSASFSGEQDDDSGSASEDMPPVNRLAESDSDEDASESEEEAAPKQASLVPSSPSPSPSPEPLPKRKSLAQLSGQDVARNKIMQASLFQASQASTSGPSYLRGLPLTSKPSSSASQPLQSTSTPLGLLGDVEAPSEEESDKPDVHTAAKLPGRAPRAPTKLQRMPHNHSVVNSDAANPALRLTRSFAPAWGPDGILAGPTDDILSRPSALQVKQTSQVSDSTITSLEQLLKIKLAHTTLTTDDDGIPQASSLPTLRFSHFEPCGVHKQVFSLGRALFDPLGLTDMPAEQSDTISAHARRAALLSWWSEHTATDVENAWRKAANPLEGTYALLTGYQIARATDSAADQLDLRLATLLSQAGTSSVDFKTDVHNQLLKWQNLDMSNHIDKTYRAILSLLAGHAPPTSLDWRRRLACTLFYHSDDLSRALNSYMPTGEAEEDYSYELVRLFCRLSPALEHTLLPHHFPGSTTVERNLQSWITHQLLSKVHRFTDFEEPDAAAAQLSVDLAASLESAGLWPWAVFVLLHLPSAFNRQKTIKDMLGRHALQMDDDTLTLLRDFSVPSAWVSEAQARLALAEGDHFAAAQHFVEADLLPEAHELVVWDLAPEVVLSQDMDTLDALLEPFIGRELACHFSEGGRLFQVYASAMRLQEDLQAGRSETIAALREELPRVLVALPTFLVKRGDSRRPLVREAAVSQMLASCTKIWGLLDSTGMGDIGIDAKELSDPADYVCSLAWSGFEQGLSQACA